MKKIFYIISTILFCNQANSQMIVNDPVNTSINSAIQLLTEGSQNLHKFMSNVKVLEMATDGLNQIQSIQEIAKLIDDLACLTTEFSVLINLQTNYNCVRFLNVRLIDINLKYSTELLTSVLLTKNLFTMSSEARLSNLNRIKETLENTIKEIQKTNTTLRSNLIEKKFNEYIKSQYRSNMNSLTYNRYKNR